MQSKQSHNFVFIFHELMQNENYIGQLRYFYVQFKTKFENKALSTRRALPVKALLNVTSEARKHKAIVGLGSCYRGFLRFFSLLTSR